MGYECQYTLLDFHYLNIDAKSIASINYELRTRLITRAMFRKPAMIPSTKNISVNQGDVSNFRSSHTPNPSPIKIANDTEIPRLL